MSKTLGQIAYEAAANFQPPHRRIYAPTRVDWPWSKLQIGTQQIYDAAASAVRSKVIEECIQKLRGDLQAVEDTVCLPAYRDGFADAFKALHRLEALTALKDKADESN